MGIPEGAQGGVLPVVPSVVYGFRSGSRNYPSGIVGPFESWDAARHAAQKTRAFGGETGRVRKVTSEQLTEAQAKLARGVLASGW